MHFSHTFCYKTASTNTKVIACTHSSITVYSLRMSFLVQQKQIHQIHLRYSRASKENTFTGSIPIICQWSFHSPLQDISIFLNSSKGRSRTCIRGTKDDPVWTPPEISGIFRVNSFHIWRLTGGRSAKELFSLRVWLLTPTVRERYLEGPSELPLMLLLQTFCIPMEARRRAIGVFGQP